MKATQIGQTSITQKQANLPEKYAANLPRNTVLAVEVYSLNRKQETLVAYRAAADKLETEVLKDRANLEDRIKRSWSELEVRTAKAATASQLEKVVPRAKPCLLAKKPANSLTKTQEQILFAFTEAR